MRPEEDEGNLSETIDWIRRVVKTNRWWIFFPASVVMIATVFVVRWMPNRYTSEATLLVVQQRVPERYVVPNSTTSVSAELQAMQQEALSRTQLQEIIRQFGLYPKESARLAPEEVLVLMQKDINITPLAETTTAAGKDFNAFKISFTAGTSLLAQQVTSMLTSLIIQQNLKTRSDQAKDTTSFLHEQLEAAKKRLADQEQRLRDFKMQNLGELPEQQPGNLAIMASLQSQLQNSMATLSRAQEQRAYLESLLSNYAALSARHAPLPGSSNSEANTAVSPVDLAQSNLIKLQAERAKLLGRFTSTHPDVVAIEHEVAWAETALARLKADDLRANAATPGKTGTQADVSAATPSAADQPAIAQTKSQLESNRLEMQNLTQETARLKASLAQYETRLNQTPVREQQLTGLLRDYDLEKQNYTDLVNKELQSQLATNLEKDQGGRQFRLVDPPSLPMLPSSPNRLKLNVGAAFGGLFLGLVMAFLMSLRDRSFHSEKQLIKRFDLPLVVAMPVLLTPGEKRARAWRVSFEWLAGSALALLVGAIEFYAYRHRG